MTDQCPECHADLTGPPIPVEHRHFYEGSHFSRLVGIVEHDRVARWRCPDCGHEDASAGAFRGKVRNEAETETTTRPDYD